MCLLCWPRGSVLEVSGCLSLITRGVYRSHRSCVQEDPGVHLVAEPGVHLMADPCLLVPIRAMKMKNNAHFISDDAQLNQHCLEMHSLKCPRPLRCVASIFRREADFPVYTDSKGRRRGLPEIGTDVYGQGQLAFVHNEPSFNWRAK